MANDGLKERIKAVERLTKLFRLERIVHLVVTCSSLAILLFVAVRLIYEDKAGSAELTMMFGSSGLITYSASRLLHMWNQALRVIAPELNEKVNEISS